MIPRVMPIFPLPLVLFPGTSLPLHIFEPRYRQMLADCVGGDRRFGLVALPQGTQERAISPGRVGTVALIGTVESLPDGRSNIVVDGTDRFALERWVESPAPYHVAEVAPFDDVPDEEPEQRRLAERVRADFERVARAARTLADDGAPVPTLPDDPALLAFSIASVIDLDLETRQGLLASRSAGDRLRELGAVLAAAVEGLERRAAVHRGARRNGDGPDGHADVAPEPS